MTTILLYFVAIMNTVLVKAEKYYLFRINFVYVFDFYVCALLYMEYRFFSEITKGTLLLPRRIAIIMYRNSVFHHFGSFHHRDPCKAEWRQSPF